ncbi:unnamed protein product [Rhizophagus irregularis]|nr:unnamed protein product [Rhizophagus irregularis]CAB5296618.1 unnamed protein product [Rhizophagus irregularis]
MINERRNSRILDESIPRGSYLLKDTVSKDAWKEEIYVTAGQPGQSGNQCGRAKPMNTFKHSGKCEFRITWGIDFRIVYLSLALS